MFFRLLPLLLFAILPPLSLAQPSTPPPPTPVPVVIDPIPPRSATTMARRINSAIREIQHRRGGSLDARLNEIWQAIVAAEPEFNIYQRQNPRRFGTIMYLRASGESGERTVRIFFYRGEDPPEKLEGSILNGVKQWHLAFPAAVAIAENVDSAIRANADSVEFSSTLVKDEENVEIVLTPKGARPMRTPLVGESQALR